MLDTELYAVTGVTGRTGAAAARSLLAKGKRVRVIVRDALKGDVWINQGAEVMVADLADAHSLSAALSGVQGAYVVSPPQYASDNLYTQAENMARALVEAAMRSELPKLVVLSSVGAEKESGTGWIGMNHMLEQQLINSSLSVTFLRAAYFMENWLPMINISVKQNILPSLLAPLDKKLPMIATADIGRLAAEALCESWDRARVIELEGPESYSPDDIAHSLSCLLNKQIIPEEIPQSSWSKAVAGQNFSPAALAGFIEMTQGLNSGHIAMDKEHHIECRKGNISLERFITSI